MTTQTNAVAGRLRVDSVNDGESQESPRLYLHQLIQLEDGRYLGDDFFRAQSMKGSESVGSPFQFSIELHANSNPGSELNVKFSDLMGRPVSLGIEQPKQKGVNYPGGSSTGDRFRRAVINGDSNAPSHISIFNGIVTRFGMRQPGIYQMEMAPSLHRLSLTNQYFLHAGKTIREMIEWMMEKHGIDYSTVPIQEAGNPANERRQDWLQAGESDYDFLQRLLEKAHIHFYFLHQPSSHTVVFSNKASYPAVFSDDRAMRYTYTSDVGRLEDDQILHYGYEETLKTSGVNSVFTRQQEAWETDKVAGEKSYPAHSAEGIGDLPFNLYKIYQYGGSVPEAESYTRHVQESLDTSRCALNGASRSPLFRSGHYFSMVPAEGNDENDEGVSPRSVRPTLAHRPFVIIEVKHECHQGGEYFNQFSASEATGLITSFNMSSTHQGSILATVVDDDGGSNHGDWRFYNRAVFDPNSGQYQDLSSSGGETLHAKGVYVRLSTGGVNEGPMWVKLAAHMQTAPEIGAQVMIGRSNDDSELPEVQSIVQANGSYTVTPSGWIANTQVGCSYGTSYGDRINLQYSKQGAGSSGDGPLSFDAAKKELLDRYESGVYRDCSYSEGGSYSHSTAIGGRGGVLSESKTFGSNFSYHYGEKSSSYSEVDHHYSKSWTGDSENHSTVERNTLNHSVVKGVTESISRAGESRSQHNVDGDSVSSSIVGGSSSSNNTNNGDVENINTSLGNHFSSTSVAGVSTNVSSSGPSFNTGLSVGASVSSNLQVGVTASNHTVLGNSSNVSFTTGNASSMNVIAGTRLSLEDVLLSESISMAGVSSSESMTGSHTAMNFVGESESMSIAGKNTQVNVAGSNSTVNVTGSSMDVSIHGATTKVDIGPAGSTLSINPATMEAYVNGVKTEMPDGIIIVL